eukprot:CAMPEP_0119272250 /NCGR_PEP_ID=MMETSP1329-20130426/8501_1 /TAXON_ID=114041 /ORGANISM="Genus nov. species nov., Strain RCC1024" /LENGTH=367 /DNA_ID=CAMNT_0007272307 /DNA_START=90 /DNA_END=1190 /DNA_ORIENTATION=-
MVVPSAVPEVLWHLVCNHLESRPLGRLARVGKALRAYVPESPAFRALLRFDWPLALEEYSSQCLVAHRWLGLGALVASVNKMRDVRFFDAATGVRRAALKLPQAASRSCAAALAGGRMVFGQGCGLVVFDVAGGRESHRVADAHTRRVNCLAACGGGFVSGSDDKTLKIWEFTDDGLACVKRVDDFYRRSRGAGEVLCVAALADRRLVFGRGDSSVGCYDVADEYLVFRKGHRGPVKAVVGLDEDHAVSASQDATLKLWDWSRGYIATLRGHAGPIYCLAALAGSRVVSASDDRTLRVWAVHTGVCLQTLRWHKNYVNCVCALPDGRVVSCSSAEKALVAWVPAGVRADAEREKAAAAAAAREGDER